MESIERMILDVEELVPNPDNPNEMNNKEFNLLCDSIKELGFIDPPQAAKLDNGKYLIIGGEHRWKAAKHLGIQKIPVDVLQGDKWESQDLIDFVTVRMNTLHGKMNPEKFLKVYNRVVTKYGKQEVAKYMGYTSEDGIKKIIGVMAKTMKESLPPEMAEEFEKEAKKAKTVADLNNIIQKLFDQYGDTIKYNFMIFSWGGKEHIFVAMNKEVHQAMKKIIKKAKKEELDINEMLGDAIIDIAKELEDIE